ncbi:putative neutral ceramidase C [Patiria miniata]|uniref:Neutral ceramidase n=1 Tax=Patiria miniata TaxID=46514 RepID=A0A914A8N3_PATMI|nr:putative neutral ceramidase C [Patiria miniata]
MMCSRRAAVCLALTLLFAMVSAATPAYKVGVGISDVTGPALDVNMMGYASFSQNSEGIHLRLFSRAFITCDLNQTECNVFVSADIGMASTLIKLQVIEKLREEYEGQYNEINVAISGTHTHSGPGGYFQYSLYTITALGMKRSGIEPIVAGIVQSIRNAHNNLQDGNISYKKGELLGANINRSPTAYLKNPKDERDKYLYDVDKEMTVLKFEDKDGNGLGVICWFPVHPVSMENTNKLISSDNKGFASYLFEMDMNPGSKMGEGSFVAAFPNSNHGDTTPHVNGTVCIDTGEPCEEETSTCGGEPTNCLGGGPGNDMYENTRMIAEKLYEKAKELYDATGTPVSGPVSSIQQYVNMSSVTVTKGNETFKTCTPALGYSFAAGTTDGPGIASFKQGMTKGESFWDNLIRSLFNDYEATQECQEPKPVLLPAGDYINTTGMSPAIQAIVALLAADPMVPDIVETQLLRIGQFVIIPGPVEFTTMSGRRMMEKVKEKLVASGMSSDAVTMITSLSNAYTNYVTTYEEYTAQRYEGASTMYGPHTLDAYLQQYLMLAENLVKDIGVETPGPDPPSKPLPPKLDLDNDAFPEGKKVGDINQKVDSKYRQGSTAEAIFWSADPKRGFEASLGTSFFSVEKFDGTDWIVIANDADWNTKIFWRKADKQSRATVQWMIPEDAELGMYRFVHSGRWKQNAILPFTTKFETRSGDFEVVSKDYTRPKTRK